MLICFFYIRLSFKHNPTDWGWSKDKHSCNTQIFWLLKHLLVACIAVTQHQAAQSAASWCGQVSQGSPLLLNSPIWLVRLSIYWGREGGGSTVGQTCLSEPCVSCCPLDVKSLKNDSNRIVTRMTVTGLSCRCISCTTQEMCSVSSVCLDAINISLLALCISIVTTLFSVHWLIKVTSRENPISCPVQHRHWCLRNS